MHGSPVSEREFYKNIRIISQLKYNGRAGTVRISYLASSHIGFSLVYFFLFASSYFLLLKYLLFFELSYRQQAKLINAYGRTQYYKEMWFFLVIILYESEFFFENRILPLKTQLLIG